MCGIAGFVSGGGFLDPDRTQPTLQAMTDALRHRGPDGEGYHIEDRAALGHRRLSIIDLETGAQPMSTPDGGLVIVFNGEIYNYRALRAQLQRRGRTFRTQSDTEVILAAYAEYGDACLTHLNGMFAFALWDVPRRRLFAARDRMGQKPLHYALCGDVLIFGSELKALLSHPAVKPFVSPRTLRRYLAFGYVPAPDTIYEGIHKLLPGHKLIYENGRLTTAPYWRVDFERAALEGLTETELVRRFEETFRDAVGIHLVSDVPLGVFLSGGIDSSAVVAMMCDLMPPKDVKTFSIGFREKSHDESAYARLAASRFGTDHHEQVLDEAAMLEQLPSLIAHMDEPFSDASLSPTSLVSAFARKHVTVALGGDGGDELFAGYNTFQLDRLAAWYARLPRLLRRSVIEPGVALAGRMTGRTRWRRGGRYVGDAADVPGTWRVMLWSEAVLKPALMEAVLALPGGEEAAPESLYEDTIRLYEQAPKRSRMARAQYQFQHQYLPDDILAKVDRASMMHSLEVRAPFLDPRIVDFANALPDRLKRRGSVGKLFLKRVFRNRLPPQILHRPKQGFGIPMDAWLRSGLRGHAERLLARPFLRDQGLFHAEPLERLWSEHCAGENHSGILWTVLAFQLWWQKHCPVFARGGVGL